MDATPLTAAIDESVPLIVLAPHLDDAVLSCGALIAHASRRTEVTVATFFTAAGTPPYTLSARHYLSRSGIGDAEDLYAARRAEDRRLFERLGVRCLHIGMTDALFRRKHGAAGHRFPAELAHVYPTFRLHIIKGRVSPQDAQTLLRARDAITSLASARPRLLLAPAAVGGHVDHVLLRTAAELSGEETVYYSDFPYNLRHAVDADFARRHLLSPTTWTHGLTTKADLVRGYRTQIDAMFPRGTIPLTPEVYLLSRRPQYRGDAIEVGGWAR